MESEKTDKRGTPKGAGTIDGKTVGAQGGRIGNPPFVPTDAQRQEVLTLSKVASQEIIATILGISVDTLARHFRKELDIGAAQAVAMVGGKLLEKALKGHGPSINFYLATRGKGSYTKRVELTGAGGGPIRTFDLSNVSPAMKQVLLDEVEGLLAQAGEDDLGLGDDDRTLQ